MHLYLPENYREPVLAEQLDLSSPPYVHWNSYIGRHLLCFPPSAIQQTQPGKWEHLDSVSNFLCGSLERSYNHQHEQIHFVWS